MVLSTPSIMRPEDVSSDAHTEREWTAARMRKVPQLICMYVVGMVVQIKEARLGNQFMMAAAQLVDWSGKGKPHDRQGPRLGKSCQLCGEMQASSSPPHGTMPRVEIWRGAWRTDRPIRNYLRVRSKVFRRPPGERLCRQRLSSFPRKRER